MSYTYVQSTVHDTPLLKTEHCTVVCTVYSAAAQIGETTRALTNDQQLWWRHALWALNPAHSSDDRRVEGSLLVILGDRWCEGVFFRGLRDKART